MQASLASHESCTDATPRENSSLNYTKQLATNGCPELCLSRETQAQERLHLSKSSLSRFNPLGRCSVKASLINTKACHFQASYKRSATLLDNYSLNHLQALRNGGPQFE